MTEEQCNNVVEVNGDFWMKNDYMRILNSGVPLYVDDSRNNGVNALFCSKPEIYHHPSIVGLLKSAPALFKDTACYALGEACKKGDIERVRELLIEGMADINNDFGDNLTPLMLATVNNEISVVSLLLTYKELVLDKATKEGYTALHFACGKGRASFSVIPLLGSDKRCTPVVLNKKDNEGNSPLMRAVMFGSLESLKEMEKLQGTDFRTKNQLGEGLVEVALTEDLLWSSPRQRSMLDYLLKRRKVETLKELAAHAVACQISSDTDVEKLDVPLILHPWVAGYVQTPRIVNIGSDRWSETTDEDIDKDEEDDW